MKKLVKLILNYFPRTILTRLSFIVKPIIRIYLRGNKFTDPIDGSSFRKFLPYGYNNVRENALSPSTFSLERHRLLWLYLKNETFFFTKNLKVLHFAPEAAYYKKFKNLPNITYHTTDINSPLATIKADICDLPINDDTYDFILCNHVLEHIIDDRKAMKELYRVLKKGGVGIFQVPLETTRVKTYEDFSIVKPNERNIAFGQYDHVRVYGMDFFDRLSEVGFKVEKCNYAVKLKKEEIIKYCLPENEIIPVCVK